MKKPHMTISGRRAMTGRLFVLPFYIGFALFFLKPAVESLTFAFSDVTIKRGGFDVVFSGLKNLRYIFQTDPDFTKNLVASLTSLLYTVPVVIIASLFFAIVLNAKFHGRTVVRAIFFLPVIIASGVVMEIINSDTFASGLISSSQGMDAAVSASSYGLTELLIQMGLSEDHRQLLLLHFLEPLRPDVAHRYPDDHLPCRAAVHLAGALRGLRHRGGFRVGEFLDDYHTHDRADDPRQHCLYHH